MLREREEGVRNILTVKYGVGDTDKSTEKPDRCYLKLTWSSYQRRWFRSNKMQWKEHTIVCNFCFTVALPESNPIKRWGKTKLKNVLEDD